MVMAATPGPDPADDNDLIERVAVQLGAAGLSRLEGRICAFMALHEEPRVTQGELAERLGAPKSHVSTALRRLIELDWVARIPVFGSRRDAYELLPYGIRSAYSRSLGEICALRDLLHECVTTRPASSPPQERLVEYRNAMAVMAEEFPLFMERVWARVESGDVPDPGDASA
jgi:DNA-binding MarR family transcriptional regulator